MTEATSMVDPGDGERNRGLLGSLPLINGKKGSFTSGLTSFTQKKKVTLETKMMHKTFFKDTDKMCDFNRSFVSGRCYLLPFLAKV